MKKPLSVVVLSVALLSGCATVQQKEQVSFTATVQAVRNYQGIKKEPSVGSTLAGAGIGGVLGHQVGKGNGRTVATILGVVGGAVVGSQVGQKDVPVAMQELSVLMPDGRLIKINVESSGFYAGQRVEITSNGKTAEIKGI
jgi:outer membrane lipoprotein SlyB